MKKEHFILIILIVIAVLTLLVAPFIGMNWISPSQVVSAADKNQQFKIFWELRVPRVLVAFLAGAGLSISGMCFQAMFRNPLATPFTLGVSSGASLGAALFVRLGLSFTFWQLSGISVFAFLGALGAVLLVYTLTKMRGSFSTAGMLLAGVAVSFTCSSFILLVQFVSDYSHSFRIVRWLMGGVTVAGYNGLLGLMPFLAIGTMILFFLSDDLNLLTIGDEFALSRGSNTRRVRALLFFGVSLMVGGVVAVCGPIGFVGMIAPHICRLMIGPNHRFLFPASFLFGGTFLTICDTIARKIVAPAEIPAGVLTALLGGPFFLWLLMQDTEKRI